MSVRIDATVVDSEEYHLIIHADNMNEAIEKIKEWQDWSSMEKL